MYYDLHIHTALSPCASNDMTPYNIINMAYINELDIIGITDHNSCGNIVEIIKARDYLKRDILILPGMEIETAEEVHILCFFPSVKKALLWDKRVRKTLPAIKNKESIFGRQILFENGIEKRIEEQLLLTASSLSIEEVVEEVNKLGGITIPAHIDRSSQSVLSNLGFIPDNLPFSALEVSNSILDYKKYIEEEKYRIGKEYLILQSSDAHNLEDIAERKNKLPFRKFTIEEIIKSFRNL